MSYVFGVRIHAFQVLSDMGNYVKDENKSLKFGDVNTVDCGDWFHENIFRSTGTDDIVYKYKINCFPAPTLGAHTVHPLSSHKDALQGQTTLPKTCPRLLKSFFAEILCRPTGQLHNNM